MHLFTNECTGLLHIVFSKLEKSFYENRMKKKKVCIELEGHPLSIRTSKLCTLQGFPPKKISLNLFIRHNWILHISASAFLTHKFQMPSQEETMSSNVGSSEEVIVANLLKIQVGHDFKCITSLPLSIGSKLCPHNRDHEGNPIYF